VIIDLRIIMTWKVTINGAKTYTYSFNENNTNFKIYVMFDILNNIHSLIGHNVPNVQLDMEEEVVC